MTTAIPVDHLRYDRADMAGRRYTAFAHAIANGVPMIAFSDKHGSVLSTHDIPFDGVTAPANAVTAQLMMHPGTVVAGLVLKEV